MKLYSASALAIAVAAVTMSSTVIAKPNKNTKPYPYGNPVITHMYTADASPHVMPDGRVWMVTSVDHEKSGGYSTMHKYHNFSSADMVNWIDHGPVLNITDVNPNEDPKVDDWALWAPDVIYRNGKYYMYYPIHIRHRQDLRPNGKPKVTSYIGVAVSDSMDKPFTIIQPKIPGTQGIDPSVFIDDDDQIYLYWGSQWAAKLADNMVELASEPVKLDIGTDNFMEAPWVHKRQGVYYFNYHTKYGNKIDRNNPDDPKRAKSHLDYSYSTSPMGPFKHGGIMNYELGYEVDNGPKFPGKDYVPWRLTQSNHGGVVEFHGQDYLFYHTSALSSWRQDEFENMGTWTQRSVSIDRIDYNADGTLIPVQQTIEGVSPVKVSQDFSIPLGTAKVSQTPTKFSDIQLGSGYYYFSAQLANKNASGKIELRLDAPNGTLIGSIALTPETLKRDKIETFLREAYGKHDVYINYTGQGSLKLSKMQFSAGSPKVL
ncbi:family 43 glycosylhydrolase [Echinimonas agarilytica]|uniref:Family 43 glycosylhydrolase n=1 Tax=Echinimonas agarilytica TaxID=1215918 RepID=A0AA41W757_9GAMM|nr:family 43 glycosylhydrolase [Echinimonas agarilytica]MCM2679877.1 family 43 glycosylhydrolase [Echinimonas agarilytica]